MINNLAIEREMYQTKMRGALISMAWIMILVLVMSLAMAGISFAQDDEEDYEAVLELGRQVYEIRCLLCHGIQGDGKGYVGIIRRVEKSGRILEVSSR